MAETIPEDLAEDLQRACDLHKRASSDYRKCLEFNQLMSELLTRLEDAHCYRLADRIMTILLDCHPKDGCHCDKSQSIEEKVKKLSRLISDRP